MLRVWVLACLLLTCSACALTRTSKPEPLPPPPIKRVVIVEQVDCTVPEVPLPETPRAANAADATTEETALAADFAQAAQRVQALQQCIERHNENARKRSK